MPRKTAATRAVMDALLEFDLSLGTYGRMVIASSGLPGGSVYPILARLEAAGVVESYEEDVDPRQVGRPRRRYWRFTSSGAALAEADVAERREKLRLARAESGKTRPAWGVS